MKKYRGALLAILLSSPQITHAIEPTIEVATGVDDISCSAHFMPAHIAKNFFFADELISFFVRHQSDNTSTGIEQTVATNKDLPSKDALSGAIGNAGHSINDEVGDTTHDLFNHDVSYHMGTQQKTDLRQLHTKYMPISVNLLNNTSEELVITRKNYLEQLVPYLADKVDVLQPYPLLQPLDPSQILRTKCYAGGGGLLTLGACWYGFKGYTGKGIGKLNYLYSLVVGVPGLALLYAAYQRYYGTQMPLEQLLYRYANLVAQTQGPLLTTLDVQCTQTLPEAASYVIPPHSMFCEIVFADRAQLEAAGITELTLKYTTR